MVQRQQVSLQDHRGRIHSWSHSMAALGMNSSISSYLPHYKKPSFWQSSTGSSTTSTDRIRLSRGVRPWKSSSNGKRPDQPTSSHKNWSSKGGHVTGVSRRWSGSTHHLQQSYPKRSHLSWLPEQQQGEPSFLIVTGTRKKEPKDGKRNNQN